MTKFYARHIAAMNWSMPARPSKLITLELKADAQSADVIWELSGLFSKATVKRQ